MSTGEEATRQAIRARLRELVASARAGERLPSERDLAKRWGAARMTVRHATDALVAEGLVERRHGSGTYVIARPIVRFLGLTSFTQDMQDRGLVAGARVLAFEELPADGPTAAELRIPVGTPVVRFTRLRTGDGEPMAVETVSIPAATVPGLAAADLDGSLYALLAARYRLAPGSAKVVIEPVLPDEATGRLLGIGAGQACLRLRMTDSDTRGRALMTADCIYRGDRYQLTADVSGPGLGAAAAGTASLRAARAG
ncbi:MAG: GntR family transcriptional regulator [Chloroflexota bacterium]